MSAKGNCPWCKGVGLLAKLADGTWSCHACRGVTASDGVSPVSSMDTEAVDHPAHYGGADNLYEAIKVIEAWGLGFCLGNTVKYISRAGKKGDRLEDLKKARWYLDREIERLEKRT